MFTPQNTPGKSRVPEVLAAVIQAQRAKEKLAQAAQQGQFQSTTQTGQPTVAEQQLMGVEQLMQQMVPPQPAVQQVAQQAGLGNQIQAMQQQQAQQQAQDPQAIAQMAAQMMAQRQAQQSQMDQGIASAPGAQAVRMAEGGIVGYAGDEDSYVIDPQFDVGSSQTSEPRLRAPQENRLMTVSEMRSAGYPDDYIQKRLISEGFISEPKAAAAAAPAAPAPAPAPGAPPAPPPGSTAPPPVSLGAPKTEDAIAAIDKIMGGLSATSDPYIKAASDFYKDINLNPPAPGQVAERAKADRAAARQYAIDTGNDPDMIEKQLKQAEDIFKRRDSLITKRIEEISRREKTEPIIKALLGARGFKGQGLGAVFGSAGAAAMASEESLRGQRERLQDLQLEVEAASQDRMNALKSLKYNQDMGLYDKAKQDEIALRDATNRLKMGQAQLSMEQASIASREAQTRAHGAIEMIKLRSDQAYRAAQIAIDQRKLDQGQAALLFEKANRDEAEIIKIFSNSKKYKPLQMLEQRKAFGALSPQDQKEYETLKSEYETDLDKALEGTRKLRDLVGSKLGIAGMAATRQPTIDFTKIK